MKNKKILKIKLFEKYSGKLTSQVAKELQDYVIKSRNEWENRLVSNVNSIYKILAK